MKKLNELNGDQFFDVLYALTPILPALEKIDLFDMYVNGTNGKIAKVDANSTDEEKMAANKSYMKIIVQGIGEILKLITSRENRGCAWEVLSIVDGVTTNEARSYLAPIIWHKLKTLFSGDGIKAFFPQSDKSELAE